MDLHTGKSEINRTFSNLQNEDLITRSEDVLIKEEELKKRIDQSLEDSQNGNLTEVNALIEEIEEWN